MLRRKFQAKAYIPIGSGDREVGQRSINKAMANKSNIPELEKTSYDV
jgi:hypothetical protein